METMENGWIYICYPEDHSSVDECYDIKVNSLTEAFNLFQNLDEFKDWTIKMPVEIHEHMLIFRIQHIVDDVEDEDVLYEVEERIVVISDRR